MFRSENKGTDNTKMSNDVCEKAFFFFLSPSLLHTLWFIASIFHFA